MDNNYFGFFGESYFSTGKTGKSIVGLKPLLGVYSAPSRGLHLKYAARISPDMPLSPQHRRRTAGA